MERRLCARQEPVGRCQSPNSDVCSKSENVTISNLLQRMKLSKLFTVAAPVNPPAPATLRVSQAGALHNLLHTRP